MNQGSSRGLPQVELNEFELLRAQVGREQVVRTETQAGKLLELKEESSGEEAEEKGEEIGRGRGHDHGVLLVENDRV